MMKYKKFVFVCSLALALAFTPGLAGQNANSLHSVRSVFVGSFGTLPGADELRRELVDVLRHDRQFRIVDSASQADAVLEGVGELWIRAYHSLSPRARTNASYAEPLYGGYLSVEVKGQKGEPLWSYFANPKRVEWGDLKHNLASQVVDKFNDAVRESTAGVPSVTNPITSVISLHGGGATFPWPIYEQWFVAFRAKYPQAQFTYDPVGSKAGIESLLSGSLDFAGSDLPLGAWKSAGEPNRFLEFPSVVGAVVLIYNLPHFDNELRLDPQTLSDILTGKIQRWNHPSLRNLNRKESLPAEQIRVVHRSDGSGTTFALTEYLNKVNEGWKKEIGAGPLVNWPIGTGAAGNEGVANIVKDTPYSFGYVEFIYAFRHHLSFASVRNTAGNFVQADLPSITAAAAEASSDLHVSLSNAPGRDSYPIAAYTWLVIPAEIANTVKRTALRELFQWMLSSGQKQCMALGYSPLPVPVMQKEQVLLQNLH